MYKKRLQWYNELEAKRASKLIVYVTGDKPGLETQITHDVLPIFIEHLDRIGTVPKISLYLYTTGGVITVAWSLANLIRNFCNEFEVIVPFKCLSSGTLICLGANRIVMTKQGMLGPIDPSYIGPLNPTKLGVCEQSVPVPVSVEAVNAYLELAKEGLGIKDNASLSSILIELSRQIHPLSLGHVYKLRNQVRRFAKKLLAYQGLDNAKIENIINFLCDGSSGHDYLLHWKEAKNDLGLNVEITDNEFYDLIKRIYDDISEELGLLVPFEPKILLSEKEELDYEFKRILIESVNYGSNFFLSKGKLKNLKEQGYIQDYRSFEGWCFEESEIKNSMALKREK